MPLVHSVPPSNRTVKARIIGYAEIEQRFKEILMALEQDPLDEKYVLDTGAQLVFALEICVSQMKAADSMFYPDKKVHLENLERARRAISYKINSCTVEEISQQVTSAYKVLGSQ
jgi:hypothetical protein